MGGFWSQHGGTVITAALTFFGGVGIAWLRLFAKRSSSPAEILTARTSAWRELMLQSESVISRLTARNDELQERVEELESQLREELQKDFAYQSEVQELQAELRQKDQLLLSQMKLAERVLTSDESKEN